MRRLKVIISGAIVIALLIGASADARPAPLHSVEAEGLMKQALFKTFGNEWLHRVPFPHQVRCHRLGYARAKCHMAWAIGDTGFSGKGSIWLHGSDSDAHWFYRLTVFRVNEYCAIVEHGSYDECVTRIHVH